MSDVRVLLATDSVGTECKSTQLCIDLLSRMDDLELIVLYVSGERTSFYHNTPQGLLQAVCEKEQEFVSNLVADVAVLFHPWTDRVRFRHEIGHPCATVCKVSKEEQADLIIMRPHPSAWRDRIPVGGITQGILHHAEVPVLVAK